MAKLLKFDDSDWKFELMLDGFHNTSYGDRQGEQRDERLAARILDKIDEISHPKHTLESLDDEVKENSVARRLALALRELNEGGGEVIFDDREFEYLLSAVKAANWRHFVAQDAAKLRFWLEGLKSVSVKKEGNKLTIVEDKEPAEA